MMENQTDKTGKSFAHWGYTGLLYGEQRSARFWCYGAVLGLHGGCVRMTKTEGLKASGLGSEFGA